MSDGAFLDDGPPIRELVLIVCQQCQREGGNGVIGKVFEMGWDIPPYEVVTMYQSTTGNADLGDSDPETVAVKVGSVWQHTRPDEHGTPVFMVAAICRHERRTIPTAALDAELVRPRRKGRPRILVARHASR